MHCATVRRWLVPVWLRMMVEGCFWTWKAGWKMARFPLHRIGEGCSRTGMISRAPISKDASPRPEVIGSSRGKGCSRQQREHETVGTWRSSSSSTLSETGGRNFPGGREMQSDFFPNMFADAILQGVEIPVGLLSPRRKNSTRSFFMIRLYR